ncbi:hypothetical protein BGZ60DRAFT_403434 [Tricladium varicosporioides]|nr:hypothetical protein BGZ60DRAFT_403434 [Hymenoscyphus varicosporioides]
MIWKASANIPSTVHMVVTHGGFNFVPPYPEVPAVLLVNKESRANALQFFEQVRASPFYRPSGWIVNRYVEGIGPRPGLATSGVNVHNTLRNPVTGRYIDCHPPPNQPPYSTGVLLHLQGSYGYTAQPPLEGNPIVPGLQEAFSERMGQHWARVTPKFWVNFYSDVFKLTFPGYNNPYPYFQLQPMCYPSSQWVNSRPLPAKPSTKPRLGAFPWTHNEPLPQLWNKVKHLALGLSLDRTHFQNAQGFPVWSQPALNDYCANFVASIRTKFPNLNKLSFVVALDPTVPQLHGRPCDRMELRPLRSAPLVPSSGPTWQGRASLEKLELDIKSFYWNEFGATGVHDNIDLVVEVPESVVRGRN